MYVVKAAAAAAAAEIAAVHNATDAAFPASAAHDEAAAPRDIYLVAAVGRILEPAAGGTGVFGDRSYVLTSIASIRQTASSFYRSSSILW